MEASWLGGEAVFIDPDGEAFGALWVMVTTWVPGETFVIPYTAPIYPTVPPPPPLPYANPELGDKRQRAAIFVPHRYGSEYGISPARGAMVWDQARRRARR
jgi:hypothetical protein